MYAKKFLLSYFIVLSFVWNVDAAQAPAWCKKFDQVHKFIPACKGFGKCDPECGANEMCIEERVVCVTAPCDPVYSCVPDCTPKCQTGFFCNIRNDKAVCDQLYDPMPPLPMCRDERPGSDSKCKDVAVVRKCDAHSDCPGDQICCMQACGGTSCKQNVKKPPMAPFDASFWECPKPTVAEASMDCTVSTVLSDCDSDDDCLDNDQACCPGACGSWQCRGPQTKLFEKCPKVASGAVDYFNCSALTGLESQCDSDSYCQGDGFENALCCPFVCGSYFCVKSGYDVACPDGCPDGQICVMADDLTCETDTYCTQSETKYQCVDDYVQNEPEVDVCPKMTNREKKTDCSVAGAVENQCETSADCEGVKSLCCESSCGNMVCKKPAKQMDIPIGECPTPTDSGIDCATVDVLEDCESDVDCAPDGSLCCPASTCGGLTCLQPVTEAKCNDQCKKNEECVPVLQKCPCPASADSCPPCEPEWTCVKEKTKKKFKDSKTCDPPCGDNEQCEVHEKMCIRGADECVQDVEPMCIPKDKAQGVCEPGCAPDEVCYGGFDCRQNGQSCQATSYCVKLAKEKEGQCPLLLQAHCDRSYGRERTECTIDADCEAAQKCCVDGCGLKTCSHPLNDRKDQCPLKMGFCDMNKMSTEDECQEDADCSAAATTGNGKKKGHEKNGKADGANMAAAVRRKRQSGDGQAAKCCPDECGVKYCSNDTPAAANTTHSVKDALECPEVVELRDGFSCNEMDVVSQCKKDNDCRRKGLGVKCCPMSQCGGAICVPLFV